MENEKEIYEVKLSTGLTILIALYVSGKALGKVLRHFKLQINSEPVKLNEIDEPIVVENVSKEIDYNTITDSKLHIILSEFVAYLKEKYPDDVLNNFYNNFQKMKIDSSGFPLLLGNGAQYNCEKNTIKYVFVSCVLHELFHLASTYCNKNEKVIHCGFYQATKVNDEIKVFGRKLNEGYTQLMTLKAFGKKKVFRSYKYEVDVADKLDRIVGIDKMEELFLRADLLGLVNELRKYASDDDISKFLTYLELVSNNRYGKFLKKNKTVENAATFVYSFLIDTYEAKLKTELDNGIINEEELKYKLALYISSFKDKIFIPWQNYKVLDEKYKEKMIVKKA